MKTVLLLICSNVFMTIAWYGHLKYRQAPLFLAIVVSWLIAFAEYCFQVPANRIGYGEFTAFPVEDYPGSDHALRVCGLRLDLSRGTREMEPCHLISVSRRRRHLRLLGKTVVANARSHCAKLFVMRRAQAIIVIVAVLALPLAPRLLGHGLRIRFRSHDVLLAAHDPFAVR